MFTKIYNINVNPTLALNPKKEVIKMREIMCYYLKVYMNVYMKVRGLNIAVYPLAPS